MCSCVYDPTIVPMLFRLVKMRKITTVQFTVNVKIFDMAEMTEQGEEYSDMHKHIT
jgi:hypothetical protein